MWGSKKYKRDYSCASCKASLLCATKMVDGYFYCDVCKAKCVIPPLYKERITKGTSYPEIAEYTANNVIDVDDRRECRLEMLPKKETPRIFLDRCPKCQALIFKRLCLKDSRWDREWIHKWDSVSAILNQSPEPSLDDYKIRKKKRLRDLVKGWFR